MKHISTFLALGVASASSAQLINGSFEGDVAFSLNGWEWTCEQPGPVMDAPNGGGLWSASKEPSHAKGCFASFLFQRLPAAQNGEMLTLSGWVRCTETFENMCLGAYIGFGSVSNGSFQVEERVGTSGTEWTFASITDTMELSSGDTAVVILNSGFAGGPMNPLPGIFDDLVVTAAQSVTPTHRPVLVLNVDGSDGALLVSSGGSAIHALRFFDLTGRALSLLVHRQGPSTMSADVSELPSGAYIVQAMTGTGEMAARFVKH